MGFYFSYPFFQTMAKPYLTIKLSYEPSHESHIIFSFLCPFHKPILGRNSSFATEAPCLLWFHRGGTWWRWRWAPSRCCPPGGEWSRMGSNDVNKRIGERYGGSFGAASGQLWIWRIVKISWRYVLYISISLSERKQHMMVEFRNVFQLFLVHPSIYYSLCVKIYLKSLLLLLVLIPTSLKSMVPKVERIHFRSHLHWHRREFEVVPTLSLIPGEDHLRPAGVSLIARASSASSGYRLDISD